ncbi:hypothetical protein [Listeria rocourtiae]|uniref:hypothetical protein n=1 Tax=Listeria rocourtiae TaxID=647910 RepID=UPI0003E87234|nr:hypothetical protein [Listeria rocourtiae]EUJ51116.1 lipoprotein [Listeria rocourtiae FSL F6-920]
MKKLLVSFFFVAILVPSLAACGNTSDEMKDKANAVKENVKSKVTTVKEKLHTQAMDFYTDLVAKVNEKDVAYDAYMTDITIDAPSKGEALDELAKKASASAEKVSETLANVKIPDLGKRTDDFKASIQELSDAFAEKATAIKANPGDTKAAEKADAAIQKASDGLSDYLKKLVWQVPIS